LFADICKKRQHCLSNATPVVQSTSAELNEKQTLVQLKDLKDGLKKDKIRR
jgi:hypothetical protein